MGREHLGWWMRQVKNLRSAWAKLEVGERGERRRLLPRLLYGSRGGAAALNLTPYVPGVLFRSVLKPELQPR